MELKKQYRELIMRIKASLKNDEGKAMRNEDIATRLGYERSYFSTLLGARGEITEKHLRALQREFSSELAGGEVGKPNNKEMVKGDTSLKELQQEIIESRQQIEQLQRSLDTLLRRQQVIAAMNDASLEALLYDLADRLKLGRAAVKHSVRNRAFSKLDQFSIKGIEIESYI